MLECRNQACRVGDVYVKDLLPVLVEDTALRVLEEDVVKWIASVPFLLHCAMEVVVHILRFPVSERDSVCVKYHAVEDDAVACWGAHRILRNERGIRLFGTGIE